MECNDANAAHASVRMLSPATYVVGNAQSYVQIRLRIFGHKFYVMTNPCRSHGRGGLLCDGRSPTNKTLQVSKSELDLTSSQVDIPTSSSWPQVLICLCFVAASVFLVWIAAAGAVFLFISCFVLFHPTLTIIQLIRCRRFFLHLFRMESLVINSEVRGGEEIQADLEKDCWGNWKL